MVHLSPFGTHTAILPPALPFEPSPIHHSVIIPLDAILLMAQYRRRVVTSLQKEPSGRVCHVRPYQVLPVCRRLLLGSARWCSGVDETGTAGRGGGRGHVHAEPRTEGGVKENVPPS
jgi:hypothetical protein